MAREVSGCVTDGTLQGPLSGMKVRLSLDGSPAVETVTDGEGCYRMSLDPREASLADFTEGLVRLADPLADPLDGASDASGPNGHLPRAVRLEVLGPAGGLLAASGEAIAVEHDEDLEIDVTVPARRMSAGTTAPQELRFVHGEPVDLSAAGRLSVRGLRDAYGYLKHPHREARNIDLIQRAFPYTRSPWPEPPFLLGECTDGWGDAMRRLLAERGAPMGEHEADDLPPGAPVHTFYGDRVLIRYTTDGAYPQDQVESALPTSDEEVLLPDGAPVGWVRHRLSDLNVKNTDVAPAYVQRVALLCDHFVAALVVPPFALLDPRGSKTRLEVRIFHQRPFAATTHPALEHVQLAPNNDFEVNRRALAYVIFLRSAYRYEGTAQPRGLRDAIRHGGAALVAEMLGAQRADVGVDPNLGLPLSASLLEDPDGPKKAARFTARLWRFLARQHGIEPPADSGSSGASVPIGGFDLFRGLLEATADAELRYEPDALRSARRGLPWWGSFDRFVSRSGMAGPPGAHDASETSWGNWLVASVVEGLGIQTNERRFLLSERDRRDRRGLRQVSRGASPGDPSDRARDAAILGRNGDLHIRRGGRRKRRVTGLAAWSARVFRLRPRQGQTLRNASISYQGGVGLDDALVQILRVGTDGSLSEVHRYDEASFTKVVNFEDLAALVVIVAGRDRSGSFTLGFEEHAEASDVMVTPANARAGSETPVDPEGWSWAWLSPDLMVDNDDDGRADELLPPGENNKLKVRLRNRGNVRSGPVAVRFSYQPAVVNPAEDAWRPVLDARGEPQELRGLQLDPDEFRWFTVPWAPAGDADGLAGYSVRAEVVEPARNGGPPPNRDNKWTTTSVIRVRPVNDPDFIDVTVRSIGGANCSACPVPRGPGWTAEEDAGGQIDSVVGVGTVRMRLTRRGVRRPFVPGSKELEPSRHRFYPVDPRTLPPGIAPEDLITIVGYAEDRALCGLTLHVGAHDSRLIQPARPVGLQRPGGAATRSAFGDPDRDPNRDPGDDSGPATLLL